MTVADSCGYFSVSTEQPCGCYSFVVAAEKDLDDSVQILWPALACEIVAPTFHLLVRSGVFSNNVCVSAPFFRRKCPKI